MDPFRRQHASQDRRDLSDAWQRLLTQANYNDAGRPSRRMLNHIREATIDRHERTAFRSCGAEEPIIRNTRQMFVTSECHIVAGLPENRPDRVRDVLIELDRRHRYAAGIGTIVSRASSAAYARAAGIASCGNVG